MAPRSLVLRVAEAEAGVLRGDLTEHAEPPGGELLPEQAELGKGRVLRAADTGAGDDPIGRCFPPARGGGETVSGPTTHHPLHDVQALHLREARAQMLALYAKR